MKNDMSFQSHRLKNDTNLYYILVMISSVITSLFADETFKQLIGENIEYVGTGVMVLGIVIRYLRPRGENYKKNLEVLDEDWEGHY